ncbi:MAG TPA: hydantoinase/oxoprolinase family protein [Planktothrix sp.]|jgi:N-methylhydantoinase A/oxoprolinase/acetone carboxylase beta subunit
MAGDETAGKVRIGIDVGGTFTHAVALDAATLSLIGKTKVPTTHRAQEGVARGIIEALRLLLQDHNIDASRVGFIAHSTTQATNALLEGDVAPVGIIGMGAGANAWLAEQQTRLGQIELAPGKFLKTFHRFINTSMVAEEGTIRSALEGLVKEGAHAIAISEAFSVDGNANEARVLAIARGMGLFATAGFEVSQLYGLKVRTRTTVINASMLPKMIESADMTEKSVRQAGITAPIMIMRSDGGVMDIDAMRKKPILTMLSGPAAGVAAAMMFLHISDGIFMEVGGTSTDISAISNGRAQIRPGEIGGHKVYMRTLDVRTVGVAGGSMLRVSGGKIVDVGPRSAHIAGLHYVSFTEPMGEASLKLLQPKAGDPPDYVGFSESSGEAEICLTPTCASNLLGLVPDGDVGKGNLQHIKSVFNVLAKQVGSTPEAAAEETLRIAAKKCIPIVKALIKDHKLDADLVTLVGGGGGAAAIVPFVAKEMGMRFQLAEHADVVSAIGVGLALIRETVERQVIDPKNEDILKIREEAQAAVQKMGADPASIEVQVEVDTRTNTLRATAFGATSMQETKESRKSLSDEERLKMLAGSMRVSADQIKIRGDTGFFQVYQADWTEQKLLGLLRTKMSALRVLDSAGSIRLQSRNADTSITTASKAESELARLSDSHALWGDAGKVIPDMLVLAGPKIIDLSGLLNIEQILALAKIELEHVRPDAPVVVIAKLG